MKKEETILETFGICSKTLQLIMKILRGVKNVKEK